MRPIISSLFLSETHKIVLKNRIFSICAGTTGHMAGQCGAAGECLAHSRCVFGIQTWICRSIDNTVPTIHSPYICEGDLSSFFLLLYRWTVHHCSTVIVLAVPRHPTKTPPVFVALFVLLGVSHFTSVSGAKKLSVKKLSVALCRHMHTLCSPESPTSARTPAAPCKAPPSPSRARRSAPQHPRQLPRQQETGSQRKCG